MAFNTLNTTLQNLYLLQYEEHIKNILLFGWFVLSLTYIFYFSKQQKPTMLFLVGTIRAVTYLVSYMYMYLFWLIYPIYIHPAVSPDQLLIFLASLYSVVFSIVMITFFINMTAWLPKLIISKGKLDLNLMENYAIKKYFGGLRKK